MNTISTLCRSSVAFPQDHWGAVWYTRIHCKTLIFDKYQGPVLPWPLEKTSYRTNKLPIKHQRQKGTFGYTFCTTLYFCICGCTCTPPESGQCGLERGLKSTSNMPAYAWKKSGWIAYIPDSWFSGLCVCVRARTRMCFLLFKSPISVSLHIQAQMFNKLYAKIPPGILSVGHRFSRRKWVPSHTDSPFSATVLLTVEDCACNVVVKNTVCTEPVLFNLCACVGARTCVCACVYYFLWAEYPHLRGFCLKWLFCCPSWQQITRTHFI
jgi:hypothetical protein